MNRFLLSILIIIISSLPLHAQEGFSSFYSDTANTQGSISASITPFIFETDTNAVILLSSNLQQPFEISNDIEYVEDILNQIKLQCAAYPNPATTYLILDIGEGHKKDISYQLFDLSGNLLDKQMITTIQTIIPMNSYYSSCYILKIISKNETIRSFKILKK